MACICTNPNSISLTTGNQFFGLAPVMTCDAGEQPRYVQLDHNGNTALAATENSIPMGAGTFQFANGTANLSNVPPGSYDVVFTIGFEGSSLVRQCAHTITVQGGGSGSLCNDFSTTIAVGDTISVKPAQVQGGATGFATNPANVVQGEDDPDNATTVVGVTSTGIDISGDAVGTTVFTVQMQDGSTCQFTITVQQSGGGTGNCNNFSDTITVGTSVVVTPAQVQNGAAGFASDPADIVQGENDPDNATSVIGVTSTGITVRGDAPGTTVFTVEMGNGETCDFTITVQSATTGSNCGTMTGFSIPANAQNTLTTVGLGLSSTCSIISASWVAGNGGATVQAQVDNTVDITPDNGTTSGTLVLQISCNGTTETCNGWPVTVSPSGNSLSCLGGTFGPFFAGQTVNVSQFVSGGVAPFTLNSAPVGGMTGNAGATTTTVGTTLATGTHSAILQIRDGAGDIVNCTVQFTVTDQTCTEEVSGSIASPANPNPGETVTLSTQGCDCPGFAVRWEQTSGTTVQLSNSGVGQTVTYTHPSNASPGEQLCFRDRCCPE